VRSLCLSHFFAPVPTRASSPNAGNDVIQEKFASSQDAFDDVVKYFGENPKTTPPSVFFPVFVRFVKAYKVMTLLVINY
jgi:hypothetical protein